MFRIFFYRDSIFPIKLQDLHKCFRIGHKLGDALLGQATTCWRGSFATCYTHNFPVRLFHPVHLEAMWLDDPPPDYWENCWYSSTSSVSPWIEGKISRVEPLGFELTINSNSRGLPRGFPLAAWDAWRNAWRPVQTRLELHAAVFPRGHTGRWSIIMIMWVFLKIMIKVNNGWS